eukprot:jgi/Galph1/536/GphlegSOOS_G5161.1
MSKVHKEFSTSVLADKEDSFREEELHELVGDLHVKDAGTLFLWQTSRLKHLKENESSYRSWKTLLLSGRPFRVFLLYGAGGGGHLATAQAVYDLIKERHPEWQCLLFDVTDLAGCSFTGSLYNMALEWDLVRVVGTLYSVAQVFRPLLEPVFSTKLKGRWKKLPAPDVVVSFVPFLNSAIIDSLPEAHHLTVMTDFINTKAHPWLQDKRQIVLCGTVTAIQQAIEQGYDVSHVKPISGMVVHSRFYQSLNANVVQLKRSLIGASVCDINNSRNVLILIGAYPPYYTTLSLVSYLCSHECSLSPVNVIVVCGGNVRLYETLSRMTKEEEGYQGKLVVVGYTKRVADYMRISDLVISKPGPGVVAESSVMNVPLLILCINEQMMEQEREVANWVIKHGIGRKIVKIEQVGMISKEEIVQWRANMNKLGKNRALFEVLEEIELCQHKLR